MGTVPHRDPRSAAPRVLAGGCGKPVLVGCGLALLLLLVGSIWLVGSAADLFRWGLSQTRAAILEALPDGFTEAERQRLEGAFEAVALAGEGGNLDTTELQLLQSTLGDTRRRIAENRLEREDLLELTRTLEEIAGLAPKTRAEGASDR